MAEQSYVPTPEGKDLFAAPEVLTETVHSDDIVRNYLQTIAKVPLLSAEEEVMLSKKIEAGLMAVYLLAGGNDDAMERLAATNNELEMVADEGKAAKQHMIEANLRLTVSIAKKSRSEQPPGVGLELIDMISEGNNGVIRAVEKFDYTQGYKFSTYASWWIKQSISRAKANHESLIRIPVHVFEQVMKVQRSKRELTKQLDREPNLLEVADWCGLATDKVRELLDFAAPIRSLDKIIGDDLDGAKYGDFHAVTPDFTEALEAAQTEAQHIQNMLSVLDDRSRYIFCRRFGLYDGQERSALSIGEELGFTAVYIRQIIKAAKQKLLRLASEQGYASDLGEG